MIDLVKPLSRPAMLFTAAVLIVGTLHVSIAAAAGEEHRYLPELSRSYSIAEAEEEPCGIAFDSAGNRYVSARELFTVQVYDPAGEPITEFEPEGNFGEPCDLAVDASGSVYVGDLEGMVVKYVPAEPLGADSAFELDEDAGDGGVIVEEGVWAIAVNPGDQHLFVGEGDQISEYDSDGALVGETGDAVAGASWRGLDVHGATGDVYAIDAQSDKVYVLDGTDGSVQATVTGAANPSFPGGFGNLGSAGLAVDQENGDFYVNDTMGNEVVAEFSAAGDFVSQIGPWLGEGEIKLEKVANTQAVEVDNGSASPNKGDVFALAMWSKPPLELTLGLYAFAGELTPTSVPTVANADPTGVTKTGATLKGSVDNEGAQGSSACKFRLALASAPSTPIAEPACSVDPVTGNTSKAVQAAVSGLTAGTEYVFSVVATNAGGAATASPAKTFSTLAEVPAVTAMDPAKGPAAGGATVTITGTDLSGATAVNFGPSNPAAITANTATQITVTTPAGTPGTVDVTVETAGGTSPTSAVDQYTYVAAPAVTAISPVKGPIAGGTTVTITGTGLSEVSAVQFGALAATDVIEVDSTHLSAVAPAAAAGTVDVTVSTPGGTSPTSTADEFTYVAPLALTISKVGTGSGSVSCDDGPCAASYPFGTTVTLSATAAAGSSFGGWSGGGCTGTGPCVATLETETTVTATFAADPPQPDPPPPPSTSTPPAPPAAPETGNPKLPDSAPVRGGKASIPVACRGAGPCQGRLKLTMKVKGKTVSIGSARYEVGAGGSKTVKVKLSRTAKNRLDQLGSLEVKASGLGVRVTLTLRLES